MAVKPSASRNVANKVITATTTSTVTFTPIPISGICIDNTKKVAVYMPAMTKMTYDPLCTAMFYEYNPNYLGDSTIAEKLTCLLYTSPSPRDGLLSRMPSSA